MKNISVFLAGIIFLSPCLSWAKASVEPSDVKSKVAQIMGGFDSKAVKKLVVDLKGVSKDLPTHTSQTSWYAGVEDQWDEARVERLVHYIRHADQILKQTKKFEQEYMFVFKNRRADSSAKQWLVNVGASMKRLIKQSKQFEKQISYLKVVLPKAIAKTKQDFQKSSSQQRELLQLRLKAQNMCSEAVNHTSPCNMS